MTLNDKLLHLFCIIYDANHIQHRLHVWFEILFSTLTQVIQDPAFIHIAVLQFSSIYFSMFCQRSTNSNKKCRHDKGYRLALTRSHGKCEVAWYCGRLFVSQPKGFGFNPESLWPCIIVLLHDTEPLLASDAVSWVSEWGMIVKALWEPERWKSAKQYIILFHTVCRKLVVKWLFQVSVLYFSIYISDSFPLLFSF